MRFQGYEAKSAGAKLELAEIELPELGPNEVDVRVSHCGICHTDVAMIDDEWKISQFPVVPGHEIVGTVAAVGSAVDSLAVGQRVGVGALCGACMRCEWCQSGADHLCPNIVATVTGQHKGGFASIVRVDNWQFAYPLPEAISSEHAGPLFCAGTTVFTPILRYGVRPTDRVAVVGIGGLGHLAVQFLAKWGCDVTAISSTHDKDEVAHGLGARHFLATRGTTELRDAARSFDFILSTVGADLPWDEYVAALRPGGKLCIVGIPPKPLTVTTWNLLNERAIVGGQPGSIAQTRQMLDFAARHGIRPIVETFPMSEINAAVERTRSGKARFRAVLVA